MARSLLCPPGKECTVRKEKQEKMGVRRDTPNRLTLYRTCATCGRGIVTTASSPFMRLVQADGHAKISYYCSERCKAASYKHLFDGRAGDRKRERDAARSAEKNRRYYEDPPGAGKRRGKRPGIGQTRKPGGQICDTAEPNERQRRARGLAALQGRTGKAGDR